MTTEKDIEKRIMELEERISKIEMLLASVNESKLGEIAKTKKFSAKEFLINKKLQSEAQKTLALAFYLEHIENNKSFNIDDLSRAFQLAKEKRPQNINDAVNRNISRGFLMEAPEKKDNKKAWVLTSTGEKFVEELSK
jgi:hypothetical protein